MYYIVFKIFNKIYYKNIDKNPSSKYNGVKKVQNLAKNRFVMARFLIAECAHHIQKTKVRNVCNLNRIVRENIRCPVGAAYAQSGNAERFLYAVEKESAL